MEGARQADHDAGRLRQKPTSQDLGGGVIVTAENKCLPRNRTGAVVPIVDFNRCEGKDACVVVCPYDVFEVRKIDRKNYRHLTFVGKVKNRAHRGMVAYTPNADQCRACGLCLNACPEGAIKLVKAGPTAPIP